MSDENSSGTVPYLSASKMEKVMALVFERSLQNISPSYFKTHGFGIADAYLAMNVLRFLGLMDEAGKPTALAKKFQLKGDARMKEVEVAVRHAYRSLFDAVANPHLLSKDELANELMRCYGLSNRLARSAIPAFLKLCEFAGLLEEGSVLTRRREDAASPRVENVPQIVRRAPVVKVRGHETSIPFGGGTLSLTLPTQFLTNAILDARLGADLKKVTDALSEFAAKHIPGE
jgi:hypothetical protein